MKKLALYIDNDVNGTGGAQYTKSLLDALIVLSSGRFILTVIYTRIGWRKHLDTYQSIKSIYLTRSNLIKIYQALIAFDFVWLARVISKRFDRVYSFIERNKFDLVIFPSGDTIGCLVNAKSIVTIHDLMHRYERRFKESGGILRYYYRENYYKLLMVNSTPVIVDSNLGKQQVLDSYGKTESEIYILPYIAPYRYYDESSQSFLTSNSELMNKGYLFYPALFCPHKNHINLIKAIKILKDKGIRIKLILAGRKRLEFNKINKMVMKFRLSDQINFIGYVPDQEMAAYYKNALALVMPTFYGPTNIPPIEAILLDCIPIVSDNYAMPEQFEDAALYFDPYKPESIANALEALTTDSALRVKLLQNGNRLKKKFSRERFESDLNKILTSIVAMN